MTKERFPRRDQHEDRKDLIGEHPLGDIGQIILLFIFIAIWVVDSFLLKFSTFISNYVPFYFRLSLGIIILSVSAYLAGSGLRTVFGEIREKPSVIRKGVFSIVRHPIYLSAILLYLGLLFFTISNAIWPLISGSLKSDNIRSGL